MFYHLNSQIYSRLYVISLMILMSFTFIYLDRVLIFIDGMFTLVKSIDILFALIIDFQRLVNSNRKCIDPSNRFKLMSALQNFNQNIKFQ